MNNLQSRAPPQMAGAEEFNQVPKRFSHFILDQQNPHTAQKLDNLSLTSPSLNLEFDLVHRLRTDPLLLPIALAHHPNQTLRDIT